MVGRVRRGDVQKCLSQWHVGCGRLDGVEASVERTASRPSPCLDNSRPRFARLGILAVTVAGTRARVPRTMMKPSIQPCAAQAHLLNHMNRAFSSGAFSQTESLNTHLPRGCTPFL